MNAVAIKSHLTPAFERIHEITMAFENTIFNIGRKALTKELKYLNDTYHPHKFKLEYGKSGASIVIAPGISFDTYFRVSLDKAEAESLMEHIAHDTEQYSLLCSITTVINFANNLLNRYGIAVINID